MAEKSAVRQKEPEVSRKGVAEGPASLGDKLETLGQGIKAAWQSASAAIVDTEKDVEDGLETMVGEIEGAASETAHALGGAARETAHALGWAFDLPAHARRHPWLLVGGAVLLGLLVGKLVGGRRR